jgi:hypothetical protein
MFLQSGAPSVKWCYGSFSGKITLIGLTTPLLINKINVLLILEGELQ